MKKAKDWTVLLAAMLALAACGSENNGDVVDDAPNAAVNPDQSEERETVSILRPDIEAAELPPAPLARLDLTIGFPQGGAQIDEAAAAALEEVLASAQVQEEDWPIILRAHSDSAGSDRVNMRAAEARGQAVAEWLVERGIASSRIDMIVFGEQNPVEPNARPDGSANEEGRAANRRVEVEVAPLDAPAVRDDEGAVEGT